MDSTTTSFLPVMSMHMMTSQLLSLRWLHPVYSDTVGSNIKFFILQFRANYLFVFIFLVYLRTDLVLGMKQASINDSSYILNNFSFLFSAFFYFFLFFVNLAINLGFPFFLPLIFKITTRIFLYKCRTLVGIRQRKNFGKISFP